MNCAYSRSSSQLIVGQSTATNGVPPMAHSRASSKKPEPVLNFEDFPHLSYNVVEIERAELPSGGSNGTCYRYVVANSVSSVTGYRQGTKREVAQYCTVLIEDLNLRTVPKKKV